MRAGVLTLDPQTVFERGADVARCSPSQYRLNHRLQCRRRVPFR